MSLQITAKKSVVVLLFSLFSLIFVGIIFSITNQVAIEEGQDASYPSWLIIAYVAGLSMIVLPWTKSRRIKRSTNEYLLMSGPFCLTVLMSWPHS